MNHEPMEFIHKHLTLKTVLILTGLAITLYIIYQAVSGTIATTDLAYAQQVRTFILQFGILGPIVYIVINTLLFVAAPLSGTPFFLASVYVYGEWSAVYLFIVQVLGSIINFGIARIWGRRVVQRFVSENNIKKVDELSHQYGVFTLFAIRLSQLGIQDFISYAVGLTNMHFLAYFIVTFFGFLPTAIVLFLAIPRLDEFQNFFLLYLVWSIGVLIAYAVGMLLIKRYHKQEQHIDL